MNTTSQSAIKLKVLEYYHPTPVPVCMCDHYKLSTMQHSITIVLSRSNKFLVLTVNLLVSVMTCL